MTQCKGPAGPSSRLAYQTRRATLSFGRWFRTNHRRWSDGHGLHRCTPVRSVNRPALACSDHIGPERSAGNTEACVVVPVVGVVPVAFGGTGVVRPVVPGTATKDTVIWPSAPRIWYGPVALAASASYRHGSRGPARHESVA